MFAKVMTTVTLIITLLFQGLVSKPPKRAEGVTFKAVLTADIHSDGDPTRDRVNTLRSVFAAIGRNHRDADTIVMAGDMTNCGDPKEYTHLQNILNVYGRIGDRVPELGNHDSWNHSDDPDYDAAKSYFLQFCKANGTDTDTVYYTKQVKGVPFIVMGVEDCDFDDPYTSEEQLRWLGDELTKAVSAGTPVFVICHKPVEDMGDASGRIRSILTEAAGSASAPIIYVSGHDHAIGANTFRQTQDKLIELNLPSLLYTDGGGLGFIAEFRAGSVTLTGMNFLTNEPLEGYVYEKAY